jgi:hypothetical protein
MRAQDLVSVKFIQKNAPYNVGEIAGFPEHIAANLVKHKKAVLNVPEEEKAPPAPSKEEVAPPAADAEPEVKPKAKPKTKRTKKK